MTAALSFHNQVPLTLLLLEPLYLPLDAGPALGHGRGLRFSSNRGGFTGSAG